MRLIIRKDECRDGFSLWLFRKWNGENQFAKPCELEFESRPQAYVLPQPTLSVEESEFHEILVAGSEELANLGIQTSMIALKAELEAVKKHRDHLERIVDHMLRYPV